MSWTTHFIICRPGDDGVLREVFSASEIKRVKYWLQYIAQPLDIMCRTPLHPKHSQSVQIPEYCQHKDQAGKLSSHYSLWKNDIEKRFGNLNFPISHSQA
jgi:hypothetical protein